MYLIGTNRTKFIRDKFFETSFDNKTVDKADFEKLTSSELHYLASIYNWDDDKDVLTWIANSTKCDKGTALLIFWRSEPDFYTRFDNEQEADYEADVYRLVRNIIDNFSSGFYKNSRISYDPNEDEHDVYYKDPKSKWQIPDELKRPIQGRKVYSMSDILGLVGHIATTIKNKSRRQIRRLKKKILK